MGGIGYITASMADIAHNNILINTHMLEAARVNSGRSAICFPLRHAYMPDTSSTRLTVIPLSEEDAYPADPEEGYGWEKLFTEQLCRYYFRKTSAWKHASFDSTTCTVRWEHTKAAKRRRRRLSRVRWRSLLDEGEIEVWGDGLQTRSFMYIDDCVDGLLRLMSSQYREPLNLGTDELISVDGLVDLVSKIAGKRLVKYHDLTKPQGVRGRNSDNSRLREVLGWEPQIRLCDGLTVTYKWIECELRKAGRIAPALAYAAD